MVAIDFCIVASPIYNSVLCCMALCVCLCFRVFLVFDCFLVFLSLPVTRVYCAAFCRLRGSFSWVMCLPRWVLLLVSTQSGFPTQSSWQLGNLTNLTNLCHVSCVMCLSRWVLLLVSTFFPPPTPARELPGDVVLFSAETENVATQWDEWCFCCARWMYRCHLWNLLFLGRYSMTLPFKSDYMAASWPSPPRRQG